MAISEREFKAAQMRGERTRVESQAVAVSFDKAAGMINITMASGMHLMIPVMLIPDLIRAKQSDVADIEITSLGLGLHWPKLDVDLYIPGLINGQFSSKAAQAALLGAIGGKSRSAAKKKAAQKNGRKGGRPRKAA